MLTAQEKMFTSRRCYLYNRVYYYCFPECQDDINKFAVSAMISKVRFY